MTAGHAVGDPQAIEADVRRPGRRARERTPSDVPSIQVMPEESRLKARSSGTSAVHASLSISRRDYRSTYLFFAAHLKGGSDPVQTPGGRHEHTVQSL